MVCSFVKKVEFELSINGVVAPGDMLTGIAAVRDSFLFIYKKVSLKIDSYIPPNYPANQNLMDFVHFMQNVVIVFGTKFHF